MPRKKALQEKRACAFWFCKRPHYAHGYCVKHARQWERTADALAGDDTRLLYDHADACISVLQGFVDRTVVEAFTNDQDRVRVCTICNEISAGRELLVHDEDCLVVKAQQLINLH